VSHFALRLTVISDRISQWAPFLTKPCIVVTPALTSQPVPRSPIGSVFKAQSSVQKLAI
jgi:hypothetical protein